MQSKNNILNKLNEVLVRLGVDVGTRAESISDFAKRLQLLENTGRYSKLFKALFSSNEENEFKSYVFEAYFAYDFESNKQALTYEVSQLVGDQSIDFCYSIRDDVEVYFELRLLNQRDWITKSILSQLSESNTFELTLDGLDDAKEVIRLQNALLSKCQSESGDPIKFNNVKDRSFNIIVIYVSDLFLNMIDQYDCLLALEGDVGVDIACRRNIFGVFQQLPSNAPDWIRVLYGKFKHISETIHGILFVKDSSRVSSKYLNLDLEYLFIPNRNLMGKQEFDEIVKRLSFFLKPWTNK